VRIDPSNFKDIDNDVEFASLLVDEESVVVLPGQYSATFVMKPIYFQFRLLLILVSDKYLSLFKEAYP
jgi:hypothetical protein